LGGADIEVAALVELGGLGLRCSDWEDLFSPQDVKNGPQIRQAATMKKNRRFPTAPASHALT
jgi:hypothetical protein